MNEKLENILKTLRKYTSPTFLMLFGFSFLLWLLINMGHTYIAGVTVPVRINDTRIKVKCEAEGTGFKIFAHRILRQSDIEVRIQSLEMSKSLIDTGKLVIQPSSLKPIIAANTKDLRIILITDIPEIDSATSK